jgi:hypothetical protein
MDDKGGGGTARRVRLRAGLGILTLAFHCVGARSAAEATQPFGMKPLGSGRADQFRNRPANSTGTSQMGVHYWLNRLR